MSAKTAITSTPGSEHSKSVWLAVMRIYIGAYFIHASLLKFSNSYINGLGVMLKSWASSTNFQWYQQFLHEQIIPHAKFFAFLTAIGEFCVGIALLLGILSGLAAMFGLLMNINYFFATSWQGPASQCANLTFIVCELVIIFTGAGRTMGFDKYLSKKILIRYLT
ncbi:MAG: DoxX family protein [Chlamydiota bacterium]|nr:DoxX family protein [Chlamydiota bacterium]